MNKELFNDLKEAILKVLKNSYKYGTYHYLVPHDHLYGLQEEFNIYFREPDETQARFFERTP